jgi:Holliday junction resolvase RusA-like endonuclease
VLRESSESPRSARLKGTLVGARVGEAGESCLGAGVAGSVSASPSMITLTLYGEPQSMKNRRRVVTTGRGRHRRVRVIKSEQALDYTASIQAQARVIMRANGFEPLSGRLRIVGILYYRSERPDLDGELICDALQGISYVNDRQLRSKHWEHGVDRARPRAEITITEAIR